MQRLFILLAYQIFKGGHQLVNLGVFCEGFERAEKLIYFLPCFTLYEVWYRKSFWLYIFFTSSEHKLKKLLKSFSYIDRTGIISKLVLLHQKVKKTNEHNKWCKCAVVVLCCHVQIVKQNAEKERNSNSINSFSCLKSFLIFNKAIQNFVVNFNLFSGRFLCLRINFSCAWRLFILGCRSRDLRYLFWLWCAN